MASGEDASRRPRRFRARSLGPDGAVDARTLARPIATVGPMASRNPAKGPSRRASATKTPPRGSSRPATSSRARRHEGRGLPRSAARSIRTGPT